MAAHVRFLFLPDLVRQFSVLLQVVRGRATFLLAVAVRLSSCEKATARCQQTSNRNPQSTFLLSLGLEILYVL